MRPIMRLCATEEYVADKGDILHLVRRRMEERAIKPIYIRRAGLSRWNAEKHYRLKTGAYDCNISQRAMYQLCSAVGLKRTKQLPWSL